MRGQLQALSTKLSKLGKKKEKGVDWVAKAVDIISTDERFLDLVLGLDDKQLERTIDVRLEREGKSWPLGPYSPL